MGMIETGRHGDDRTSNLGISPLAAGPSVDDRPKLCLRIVDQLPKMIVGPTGGTLDCSIVGHYLAHSPTYLLALRHPIDAVARNKLIQRIALITGAVVVVIGLALIVVLHWGSRFTHGRNLAIIGLAIASFNTSRCRGTPTPPFAHD